VSGLFSAWLSLVGYLRRLALEGHVFVPKGIGKYITGLKASDGWFCLREGWAGFFLDTVSKGVLGLGEWLWLCIFFLPS
jgi:hypothetical protein